MDRDKLEQKYERKFARRWAKKRLKDVERFFVDEDELAAAELILEITATVSHNENVTPHQSKQDEEPNMDFEELKKKRHKKLARKWAERIIDSDNVPHPDDVGQLAAARLILGQTTYQGHQIMLLTQEDYEKAPIGTEAFDDKRGSWHKTNISTWETWRKTFSPADMFNPIPLTVQRWGASWSE